uniref:Thiosulfate sulfurtransferase n=1 Tax=Ascaris lumbricoides TaxID=6252 RepID=A0A0M3HYT3_ASCLU
MTPLVSVNELNNLIKENKVKVIDATFAIDPKQPKPDWKKFEEEYYGKFDKLINHFIREEYVKQHIHGAVHFNMDIGLYVGQFQRYGLYPPKVFEKYARILGINNGDHIVVYSRGPLSGMLFSSKLWWLLRYYGHENVQVLNGGLAAWIAAGYPVDGEKVVVKEGNFIARLNPQMLVEFEELEKKGADGKALLDKLETEGNFIARLNPQMLVEFEELEKKGADGKALLDKLETINFYDARPRGMYTGETPQKFPSSGEIPGFHIAGAKNFPSTEIVNEHGIKPPAELRKVLQHAGYTEGRATIVSCALGIQAALADLALTTLGIQNVKLYHGSLTEMALRDPARISGK